ncbi:neuroblast differentiation-associated protein AHNAK-like, partial [Guaruba guarouba]
MEKEEETREILLPSWQGSGSHGITIDQTDDGVFIKQVQQNSPAARMGVVREGDQIVSATVYFDNLQSGEVAQLLNTMGHHTVGLRLQRRGDKSPGPGQTWSHDVFTGGSSLEVVLSGDDEEYRRIYTTKIKPRLKSEEVLEVEGAGMQSSTITVTKRVTAYTVDVTRHDGAKGVDVVGTDFKVRIPTQELTHGVETNADPGKIVMDTPGPAAGPCAPKLGKAGITASETMDAPGGETGSPIVVEVPGYDGSGSRPVGLPGSSVLIGQTGSLDAGFHVKGPRLDGKGPGSRMDAQGELPGGVLSPAAAAPCVQGGIRAPGVDVSFPTMESQALDVGKIQIPVLKMPKFGFPVAGSGAPAPPAPSVAIPSSSIHVTGPEIPAPSIEIPSPQVDVGLKGAVKGPSAELPASHVDIPGAKGTLQMPNVTLPKGSTVEVALPKVGPAVPEVDVGIPDVAMEGEWKGPKFKKVETPHISLSDVNVQLKGPQAKGGAGVTVPRVEGEVKGLGSKGLKVDVKAPGVELESPEGLLKGPCVSALDTDIHVKGPKLKGDVDVPIPKLGGDLKGPQLDIDGPKLGMAVPDVSVKGPKVTMPEAHVKTPQI